MAFELIAAAPWQIRSDSPVLIGIIAGTVALVALLLLIGKVPLSYNIYNLQTRWLTSSLIGGAFALVIGLLTGMLAFVNGMYYLTEHSGQPGNVMILAEGSTDESFSNLGVTDVSDIENQPGVLRNEKGEPLISRETYIIVNQPIANPQPGKPKRRFLSVRGVDDPAMSGQVHGMVLTPGSRWFSDAGVGSSEDGSGPPAVEVVLGSGIATELGSDRSPAEWAKARNPKRLDVGDSFALNDRVWKVVGIMDSDGSTFDSEVWAKRSLVGPMFGKASYSSLVLRAEPNFRRDQRETMMAARNKRADENFERALSGYQRKVTTETEAAKAANRRPVLPTAPDREKVEPPKNEEGWGAEMIKEFFNTEYQKSKVNAVVETRYFENLSSTNLQLLVAIEFVAVVLAVGGVFGVMNTMFAAVSQRVKDIGVLRLLGFRRRQILVSFLIESLFLAIAGTLVGCAIGWLANGVTVNSIVSAGQGGGGKFVVLKLIVDASTLAMGMLLGVAMGFVGGFIPALAAMRLTALESLR